MIPRRMRTKWDLIRAIYPYVPTKACQRALTEDRVVVLGGFAPPNCPPFWAIRVTSQHGKEWIFGISYSEREYLFRFLQIHADALPWKYWQGTSHGIGLNSGDDPQRFAQYREQAWKREKTDGTPIKNED